jgi:hypothetical protein
MRGLGGISLSAAGLFLAVAAVVFGATTVGALRIQELAVAPENTVRAGASTAGLEGSGEAFPQTVPGSGTVGPQGGELRGPLTPGGPGRQRRGVYPRVTETEILEAVNRDLFQPDRLPPLERYQLPSERVARSVAQQDPRRRRGPELRVVGSAVMGDLALALVQVDDSIPLAVLLGESVEGYILAAVDQEGAVLVGETETLTLPVVAPLPTSGRRAGDVQIQIDQRNLEAMQERVQQLLRGQMMNRGFPPGVANPPGRGGRGGGGQP